METTEIGMVREFSFDVKQAVIRSMIDRNGEPWFVAKDICEVLEISNSRDALLKLDEDERDDVGLTDAIGRIQQTNIVNESGLYNLIFRSDKPQAKVFRKWVTSEVLPAIRKQGCYGMMRRMEIPEDLEQACAFWAYLRKQKAFHLGMVKDIRAMEKGCLDRISFTAPPFIMPADPQMGLPLTQRGDGVILNDAIGKDGVGVSDAISKEVTP